MEAGVYRDIYGLGLIGLMFQEIAHDMETGGLTRKIW